jgi:hypothetical protein
VSLPWSRTLRLRVTPHAAWATLKRGGWRAKVLARAVHPARAIANTADAMPSQAIAVSTEALAGNIEAVLAQIGRSAAIKGARLAVEWSDSLTHFDVVSGDFSGDSDRQLQAVAAACASELLGEAAPAHEIRWQLQAGGRHLLIAAIPRDQLNLLVDACKRHGLTLGSVQPDFCTQWNRHSKALRRGPAVFTVASEMEAVVACVEDGAVSTMSNGAWLDRNLHSGGPSVTVKRLLSGFGLETGEKSSVLDTRVDRLLASIGRDPAKESAYVLVAPAIEEGDVSSRWTILNRRAKHS